MISHLLSSLGPAECPPCLASLLALCRSLTCVSPALHKCLEPIFLSPSPPVLSTLSSRIALTGFFPPPLLHAHTQYTHTPPADGHKGRFLTTPELVPFRLTRDVVDGMGVNGVEVGVTAAVAAAAVAAGVHISRAKGVGLRSHPSEPSMSCPSDPHVELAFRSWGRVGYRGIALNPISPGTVVWCYP